MDGSAQFLNATKINLLILCPLGEKPEVLLRQPAYADVETFIVGTETASKGISESKKTDFVKLNEGKQFVVTDVNVRFTDIYVDSRHTYTQVSTFTR